MKVAPLSLLLESLVLYILVNYQIAQRGKKILLFLTKRNQVANAPESNSPPNTMTTNTNTTTCTEQTSTKQPPVVVTPEKLPSKSFNDKSPTKKANETEERVVSEQERQMMESTKGTLNETTKKSGRKRKAEGEWDDKTNKRSHYSYDYSHGVVRNKDLRAFEKESAERRHRLYERLERFKHDAASLTNDIRRTRELLEARSGDFFNPENVERRRKLRRGYYDNY